MTRSTLSLRVAGFLAALAYIAALSLPLYGSIIDVDAVTPNRVVPGLAFGTIPTSGLADGYDATNDAMPATFNSNFLVVSGNGTEFSSVPQLFSDVGYTTLGSTRYFAFVLDAQEISKAASLSIDSVRISVNATEVWRTTEAILLNSTANLTLTPLGNGGDMALYVPVNVFGGLSLTGSSTFVFHATHSLGDNGGDEWRLTDYGVTGVVRRFGPNDPITSDPVTPIPEPSSALLLLTGIGLVAVSRKYRPKR